VARYFFGSWAAMAGDFRAGLTQQFAAATRMQEQLGFSKESLELVNERMPQLIDMTLQLLPGLLFLTFAIIALINLLSLRRRFPERRSAWFAIENFRDWKAPERLVWGLIASGFSLFFPIADLARLIALNLLLIVGAFYFAQGLAVIAFFFSQKQRTAVPARYYLYLDRISTNLYADGCGAGAVRPMGRFSPLG
jgi:uncharacterized protein YybS (DUF2232 family)